VAYFLSHSLRAILSEPTKGALFSLPTRVTLYTYSKTYCTLAFSTSRAGAELQGELAFYDKIRILLLEYTVEIWTTGIIEGEVNDPFFKTRKFVQTSLNALCSEIHTGGAVEKIRIVFIINRDPISEFRRYNKKDKSLDIRVKIDYDNFLNSVDGHRVRLFVDAMITSIRKITSPKDNEFNKELLSKAINTIALQ
jgi:hypothetical protein